VNIDSSINNKDINKEVIEESIEVAQESGMITRNKKKQILYRETCRNKEERMKKKGQV